MKKNPAARRTTPKAPRRGAAKKTVAKKTATARPLAKKAAKETMGRGAGRPAAKTLAAAAKKKAAALLPRRAIFIDVENTSSEDALLEVIHDLGIDHRKRRVELAAVGNWRVVGQHVGRHLAGLGAQLVHSAPAKGVRDWSDLWIAVAAGVWIGQAQPGDQLEIVSNDRAFDAVGDAAAARGIDYKRVQHQRGATAAVAVEEEGDERPARRPRRRRRRSARETASPAVAAHRAPVEAPRPRQPASTHLELEPHGATRDQMVALIGRLTNSDPERWVNLDVLERELKREGFSRPPGSPRLVTRLRVLKDVEVDSHGRVRIAPGTPVPKFIPAEPAAQADSAAAVEAHAALPAAKRRRRKRTKAANGEASAAGESAAVAEPAAETDHTASAEEAAPKRRRRRRGKAANGGAATAGEPAATAQPAAPEEPAADAAPKRRRRRRSKAIAETIDASQA